MYTYQYTRLCTCPHTFVHTCLYTYPAHTPEEGVFSCMHGTRMSIGKHTATPGVNGATVLRCSMHHCSGGDRRSLSRLQGWPNCRPSRTYLPPRGSGSRCGHLECPLALYYQPDLVPGLPPLRRPALRMLNPPTGNKPPFPLLLRLPPFYIVLPLSSPFQGQPIFKYIIGGSNREGGFAWIRTRRSEG